MTETISTINLENAEVWPYPTRLSNGGTHSFDQPVLHPRSHSGTPYDESCATHIFENDRTDLIDRRNDGHAEVPGVHEELRESHEFGHAASSYHCHGPREQPSNRARNQLICVSVLCLVFMTIEIIGGFISHSLALVSDALHLSSDLIGFLISLFAIYMAKKRPTMRMSFGFYRAEVIGALLSILIIWILTAVLVYLAIQRIVHNKYRIDADTMLLTAGLGVGFNIIMAISLNAKCCSCELPSSIGHGHSHGGHGHSHGGHGHSHDAHGHSDVISNPGHVQENPVYAQPPGGADPYTQQQDVNSHYGTMEQSPSSQEHESHKMNINVKAAMVHVIGDIVQSIGVFFAAIVIKVKPEYKIADPICTFIFSVLVLITTATVLRDTFYVIMEAVPRDVDFKALQKDLLSLPGVKMVHNLHVWALTLHTYALNAHLAVEPGIVWEDVLKSANRLIRHKHHINHSTIQVEAFDSEVMPLCDQCQTPDEASVTLPLVGSEMA